MADNLPLGYNVTSFYLRDRPPAPMFEVRDPLLYKQSLGGSIFWVISSPSRNFAGQISNPELGWSEIVQLEGVIVLKDDSHAASILEAVDRMAARLEAMHPNYQLIQHTKGGVFQARRDVEGAAQAYRSAGMYFPLGNEYLRAAQGFARHGLKAEAWQQGLMAKAMEPYKPEIHTWLEEQLQAAGYADESRIEAQIAEALSDD